MKRLKKQDKVKRIVINLLVTQRAFRSIVK